MYNVYMIYVMLRAYTCTGPHLLCRGLLSVFFLDVNCKYIILKHRERCLRSMYMSRVFIHIRMRSCNTTGRVYQEKYYAFP